MTRIGTHTQISIEIAAKREVNPHDVADAIYDDFESRTCENCKYFIDTLVGSIPVKDCESILVNYPPKDFGCLKFERKDK